MDETLKKKGRKKKKEERGREAYLEGVSADWALGSG